MDMRKFRSRMEKVLPPEELSDFFESLFSEGARPRKAMRIRRDFTSEEVSRWTPDRLRLVGIPLAERVPWYENGHFFDLSAMSPHPSRHPVIAAGIGFIQEAGAMEVVPALEVEPDHLVMDLCAAPGAKSTHIGEYLGPEGWLVAADPGRDRAKLLEAILARHGIGNSTVFNLEPRDFGAPFESVFDRVLIDAPCSGESLFAKRSEKRKDVTDREVERCALRQRTILEHGARLVVAGGRLVYSTCAYSRAENEDLIGEFLEAHPDFHRRFERRRFPHRDGVPGGYLAVLERDGADATGRAERLARMRSGIRKIGVRGLVRDGRRRWDGSPDLYTMVMDRKPRTTDSKSIYVEMDMDRVGRFLSGTDFVELPKDGAVVYVWEGERVALANATSLFYPRARLGGL